MRKNILVGQSGGPTSAINATLYGVIKEAQKQNDISEIYGLRNGIEGALNDNIINLNYFKDDEMLTLLKTTPSAYLGSCRYKLKENDLETYSKIFKTFEKYNIGYFFYIGGNDSMDTVNQLKTYACDKNFDIKIIGVPKTIDNDLVITDHTPGYGSAAKYIATSFKEMYYDSKVYNKPSVTIMEIMGRHAGWLTAAASLGVDFNEHENVLIYLPEQSFNMDSFLETVNERIKRNNCIIVAISEGIKFEDGRFVCNSGGDTEKDAFGHSTLSGCGRVLEYSVKNKLKLKSRAVELNVLQRCASHFASLTDLDESALAGSSAVKYAISGETGKMVCLKRATGEQYKIETETVDVSEVCNKEKFFPKEWITKDCFVSSEFIKYASPLILGEPKIKMENGLPVYISL